MGFTTRSVTSDAHGSQWVPRGVLQDLW